MSSPLSQEELLSALLDDQLTGEEKLRAEALAASPEYESYWNSICQQREQLRALPRFELGTEFAQSTLQKAVEAVAPDRYPTAPFSISASNPKVNERPAAWGLLISLAATIFFLLLGINFKINESRVVDNKRSSETTSDGAIEMIPLPEELSSMPQVKAAGADRLGGTAAKSADEIWMVDVPQAADFETIENAFLAEGLELNLEASDQPYRAVYVNVSATSLRKIFKRISSDGLMASAMKLPEVPDWTASSRNGSDSNVQVVEDLAYFQGGASAGESVQRSQLEEINRWFELDPGLADQSEGLKKRNYLLLFRRR